jgi:hypothetical protein
MHSTHNNLAQSLETKLKTLGYSPMWLQYGVLNAEILLLQYSDFTENRDNSLPESGEHYRYATFRYYLGKHSHLTDTELDAVIVLAEQDSVRVMASAALVDILRMCHLTDAQFTRLREALSGFGVLSEKLLQQHFTQNRSNTNDRT